MGDVSTGRSRTRATMDGHIADNHVAPTQPVVESRR